MKNASEYAKRLTALLKQVRKQVNVPDTEPLGPLYQLIHAFLAWETSRNQADQAYSRLMSAVVDVNDLRVTDPYEMIDIIGADYAIAPERARRLVLALHAIYDNEYRVNLDRLTEMNKRDARAYLDKLEGMVPFVASCVMLLSLDSHAVPVDEQLVERLKRDQVVDPDATLEEVQAFLEYQIRADEGVEAFYCLRAYVERPIKVDLPAAKGLKKSKKTTKATTKSQAKAPTKKKTTKRTTKSKTKSPSKKKKTTKRTTKSKTKSPTKKKKTTKRSTKKKPATKKTTKKSTKRKKTTSRR